MKNQNKYKLLFTCSIVALIITNLSIQISPQKYFAISLKDIDAQANSSEGSWPELKEYDCFVGDVGSPQSTYLKKKRYCGNCKSERVLVEKGTGHCKILE